MVLRYTPHAILLFALCTLSALNFQQVLIFAAEIEATITTGVFVPPQPLNLAVSIGDGSVDLSWSPPVSNGGTPITDYIIEYKLSSGGVWVEYPDLVTASTTATLTGLTNDTSYDFRVSAVNAVGEGPASALVTATPGSPAQVIITGFSDLTSPSISAQLLITNEGSVAYEYQYTWCVTDSDSNLCGGGNDIFTSTAAKLIQPSENWGTNLSATVGSAGSYWFHVQVNFGSDSSYASQSFIATQESSGGGGGGGGGGGSGGGSGSRARSCVGADINKDKSVNLVDFSILILSLNTSGTFKNPCVDINRDGKVNMSDFSILLSQWGKKPVIFKIR